jgi:hypothetical protein
MPRSNRCRPISVNCTRLSGEAGERRRNDTHASTTDPDARLYRKGPGKEARLRFMGQALMENRNGLIVGAGRSQL